MVKVRFDVEKNEWVECLEGEEGLYLDGFLRKKLDNIKYLQSKNWDGVFIIVGMEGCLAGDTQIQVNRAKLSRRHTIKSLYNNFHGIRNGGGNTFDSSIPTYVRSFDGKEIRLHKINDVMYSGRKMTYILQLENKSIKATETHKFLTREGWKELRNIKIGEELMCDNLNAQKSNRKKIKLYDIQLSLKYHPYSNIRKRVEVHRLIYEARLNGLEFTDFLDILLNEEELSKKLKYIDPSIYSIHHKDGCHYNNSIDNLQLIKKDEHLKYHGIKGGYMNFSQGQPVFQKVISITPNEFEDVYDISCDEPHHNFVANGIVVHNSGKSTLGFICGQYLSNMGLSLNNIASGSTDALEKLQSLPDGSVLVVDEAELLFSSRETMTKEQRQLTKIMMVIRQKRMALILICPSFFELSKYVAIDRSRFLLRTYTDAHLNRGRFSYWGQKKKLRLYNEGKKHNGSYSKPKAQFNGRFSDYHLPFDADYMKVKAKSLTEAFESKLDKAKRLLDEIKPKVIDNLAVEFMQRNEKMTMKEIAEVFKMDMNHLRYLRDNFIPKKNKESDDKSSKF